MAEVVRFDVGDQPHERHKLRFRHRDLRDVVEATGKSIGDLITDAFGGWPYLLQFGMRQYNPKFTKDQASDLIDKWIEAGNDFNTVGEKLMQAIELSGYIKFERPKDDDAEGNGASPANTTA